MGRTVQTILLTATLTSAFRPSKAFLITDGLAVIDFALAVDAAGPAQVEWYFELTSAKPAVSAKWFREVSEENPGLGIVEQPPTVRRFSDLPANSTTRLDNQSAKAHDFCRIQIRAASGNVKAEVSTPFGLAT